MATQTATEKESVAFPRAAGFAKDLRRIQVDLNEAKRQRAKQWRLQAPQFNLFIILHLHKDEISHSRFLCELLDPRGEHGQGDLFLVSFLSEVCGIKKNVRSYVDGVTVRAEAELFKGRCDLMIQVPRRLCVVIENKVLASEGPSQLARYSEWLYDWPADKDKKKLLYLTLNGCAAKGISQEKYKPISYFKDIRNWLVACSKQVGAPQVKSILEQYIVVIDYLGKKK
jgi:hypothetical protein